VGVEVKFDLVADRGANLRHQFRRALGREQGARVLDLDCIHILFNFVNPVIAQGAALAGISLMDRFDCDITAALRTGDEVEIDPKAGEVHILRRERP
jgi:hypothetical protein